ncbi:MAG TPA: hypothetical protein VE959_11360 [Bryobacteraceae bacterium]|nr:hypothetical protein [Bryobacteraceae bacterium]
MSQSWLGIRVSAVLAILGSVLTLLFSGLLVWTAFFAHGFAPGSPADTGLMKGVLIALTVFFIGLTVWGVATGAGIFRRRGWARVSIVIFAVLLVGMGGSAMLGIFFVRLPPSPDVSEQIMRNIRLAMAAFYGGLLLIGVWWLLLFNSARAKQYFTSVEAAPESGRPLSITVIAWYLLLLAAGTAVGAATRLPAMLFGLVATGWSAMGIYTVYTAVGIYLGTGLLQLQKLARTGAIVFFLFNAANSVVSIAMPGLAGRMQAFQDVLPRAFQSPQAVLPASNFWIFAVTGALFAAVPVWFLVRRRQAFYAPAADQS